jgi:glycosyltransferase involved in cell wall biosynthesis
LTLSPKKSFLGTNLVGFGHGSRGASPVNVKASNTAINFPDYLSATAKTEELHHLKIFQVMPRRMYYGPERATSIDLCVRDLVRASGFADSTCVIAERIENPFEDGPISFFPANGRSTLSRVNHIVRLAAERRPDVIVVQAHLPTAAAIARRCPDTSVVLHSHNYQKSFDSKKSLSGQLHRAFKRHRYGRLTGIIHVSKSCARDFAAAWPDVRIPQAVVYNAFDFSEWRAEAPRQPEILCVSRCAKVKGILEAAQAVVRILPEHPGWRARFILSCVDIEPSYFAAVCAALAPLGDRARIEVQQPFAVVKAACERAAIALVPSKWDEPFGRTALEAHAGGAALISSGTGGLKEASGEHALYLPEVSADAIAEAIATLIASPELRAKLAEEGARWGRERFSIGGQAERSDSFLASLRG